MHHSTKRWLAICLMLTLFAQSVSFANHSWAKPHRQEAGQTPAASDQFLANFGSGMLEQNSAVAAPSIPPGNVARTREPISPSVYQSVNLAAMHSAAVSGATELGSAAVHGSDALLGYDIHAGIGNLHLAATDILAYPALGPALMFERHYNSQGTDIDVGLGRGWTHTYAWRISMPDPATIQLLTDTGCTLFFKLSSDATTWVPPTGEFGTLVGSETAGFVYSNKFGTDFAFDTPEQGGRLLSITPADNTPITISYSSGSLIHRVTSGNLALTFTYEGDRIRSIIDPSDHAWTYDVTENLNAITLPNVDAYGEQGQMRYLYQDVVVNGATFSAGDSASHITRVIQRQSSGVEIDRGLFSYEQDNLVRAASSALNGMFQNDLTLSYGPAADGQMTTMATLAGGSKVITLQSIDGHWRIAQIVATAGVGYEGAEWTTTEYGWNADLTLASVTDGNGVTTAYANYDARGNPQLIVEGNAGPLARATTLTYHPILSRPLTISRPSVDGVSQHTITYDYDADYDTSYNANPTNYLHQVIETGTIDTTLSGVLSTSATYTSRIFYDAQYRVTQVQGANGNAQSMEYWAADAGTPANRLQRVLVSPAPGRVLATTINAYDPNGRPSETQDPNDLVAAVQYDPLGNIIERTISSGAQSQSEQFAYNLAGDLTAYTTTEGTRLRFEHDGAGRMWRRLSETAGSAPTTPWSEVVTYDDQNEPIALRRFRGLGATTAATCSPDDSQEFCVERSYDSFRRLASVRTLGSDNQPCVDLACTITYAYDNNGNLQRMTKAGLATTSYLRDELNRVIRITQPTNVYGTVEYDINDNIIAYTDPRDALNGGAGSDRTASYTYDDFGRPISMQTPDTGLLIANYDGAGLRTGIKDALGNVMRYSYDGANRLTHVRAPVATDSLVYIYDETGTRGNFTYANTAGRLTTVQARDRLDNQIFSHYSYDFLGRLADNVEERGPDSASIALKLHYAWGANGELAALTYPDGTVVNYQYSTTNGYAPRPKPSGATVTFGGGELALVSDATYFADGVLRDLSYGNGGIRSLSRNQRGEWTHLVSGPAGSPVVDQRYEYDAEGRGLLTAVHHFQGTSRAWDWIYSYDLQNRLTGYSTNVRPTPDVYSWIYDEVGNRTSQTYNGATTTYHYPNPANNQLTALSGAESDTWTYNANGFTASHMTQGERIDYRYDTLSRLIGLSDARGRAMVAYSYDGAQHTAQRIEADGSSTMYYYSPSGTLLHEVAYTGEQQNGDRVYEVRNYVYLETIEVARIVRKYLRPCAGCTYAFIDEDVRYVHEDFRRSPFGIESMNTGALGWTGEIDPFGNWKAIGLPGADGKIGTADDEPLAFGNHTSVGKSMFDPVDELTALAGRGSAWSRPSTGDRLGGPSGAQNLLGQVTQGLSPYLAGHETEDLLGALGGKKVKLKTDGNLMSRGRNWGLLANDKEVPKDDPDLGAHLLFPLGGGKGLDRHIDFHYQDQNGEWKVIEDVTADELPHLEDLEEQGRGHLVIDYGSKCHNPSDCPEKKQMCIDNNCGGVDIWVFGDPQFNKDSPIKPSNPGTGDPETIDLSATPSKWLATVGGWVKVDKTKAYVDMTMSAPGNGTFNGVPGSELPDTARFP
jgi:YD repeat-containing protein